MSRIPLYELQIRYYILTHPPANRMEQPSMNNVDPKIKPLITEDEQKNTTDVPGKNLPSRDSDASPIS